MMTCELEDELVAALRCCLLRLGSVWFDLQSPTDTLTIPGGVGGGVGSGAAAAVGGQYGRAAAAAAGGG